MIGRWMRVVAVMVLMVYPACLFAEVPRRLDPIERDLISDEAAQEFEREDAVERELERDIREGRAKTDALGEKEAGKGGIMSGKKWVWIALGVVVVAAGIDATTGGGDGDRDRGSSTTGDAEITW